MVKQVTCTCGFSVPADVGDVGGLPPGWEVIDGTVACPWCILTSRRGRENVPHECDPFTPHQSRHVVRCDAGPILRKNQCPYCYGMIRSSEMPKPQFFLIDRLWRLLDHGHVGLTLGRTQGVWHVELFDCVATLKTSSTNLIEAQERAFERWQEGKKL